MNWGIAEISAMGSGIGSWNALTELVGKGLPNKVALIPGMTRLDDAKTTALSQNKLVSTDPPYFDSIGYGDLSDFFYVWLRHNLSDIYPDLFATVAVPKAEELVATPYRHGSKGAAEGYFMKGMTEAMRRLAIQTHPEPPITIYYAIKQADTDDNEGTTSTGWEKFLDAIVGAGLCISGTWPMRTELRTRMNGRDVNSLQSSIVLVCRKQSDDARRISRSDFLGRLRSEFPGAFAKLQEVSIAPVDLAQAAIGPGMAIYTSYSKVEAPDGSRVDVHDALSMINQVLDETLAEQEGDFEPQERLAIAWFEEYGFHDGEYGRAETLSKAKNTSLATLAEGGVIEARQGKVRLLRPNELSPDWDPVRDTHLSSWEVLHQLIRTLEADGETASAAVVAKVPSRYLEPARELAYRLYVLAERKGWTAEALSYNSLIQSWPEISRLSRDIADQGQTSQSRL